MLGFLTNRWVLSGLAVIVLLGFVHWKGYTNGKAVVQTKWDAEKVVQEREAQVIATKARETERAMQEKIDKIQKEKLHDFQTVSVRYHALLNSLRERPETRNDTPMPQNSSDVVGCTGKGLARPDAEFLGWYAAEAARLQTAYESCKAAYEVVYKEQEQTPKDQ